jgi:hypothetical protein
MKKRSGTLWEKLISLYCWLFSKGSTDYWEKRYAAGGTSGEGSYGELAEFKAQVLNPFVKEKQIESVVEFGCGDGNQIEYFDFKSYIGLDVSQSSLARCLEAFEGDNTKSFFQYNPACFADNANLFRADLALSLDVIYHLLEDEVYTKYMHDLFGAAEKYVVIYSTDFEGEARRHVRHRGFTKFVSGTFPQWRMVEKIDNPKGQRLPSFFIYERAGQI